MTANRRLILSCPTTSIEEFERLADLARELGFTHVSVGDLPKPRWQMKLDPTDPYPNWGMKLPSILLVAVPEALRPWVSYEHGQRCMAILSQRGTILRQKGLKAAFFVTDPQWLPEGVYEKYPQWRGPRCEHPNRAKRPYHAPCIDNPEMLAMYRAAVAEICRAAPVDFIEFKANDAGAGICWSEAIYMGPNGPESCRNRTYAERVTGFMSAIQDGAHDAGITAQVEFNIRTTPNESTATIPHLKPGQVIAGRDSADRVARLAAGYCVYLGRGTGLTHTGPGEKVICAMFGSYMYASHTYPVVDVPQPFLYAEQLERFQNADADKLVYISSSQCGELFDLVREFGAKPFAGEAARRQAVATVAERRVGAAAAPMLVEAWEHMGTAIDTSLSKIQYGGPLLSMGAVMQRWLIRPLVPFPLELKPEEKDYYRKHQFQARGEEQAADLMDCQGVHLIRTTEETRDAALLLEGAISELQLARSAVQRASAVATEQPARQELQLLDLRLQTLICVIRNTIYTAKYQDFLNRCGPTVAATDKILDRDADGIPIEARQVLDADIENTTELIRLLESAPAPLLAMASDGSEEDVFIFGPELLQQLRKKIQVTRDHLADHRRL